MTFRIAPMMADTWPRLKRPTSTFFWVVIILYCVLVSVSSERGVEVYSGHTRVPDCFGF